MLKLTDRSNCGECGRPTCLAFSAAVIHGDRKLGDCTKLDGDTLARYEGAVPERDTYARQVESAMEELRKQVASIDLEPVAGRIGVPFEDGGLTVYCLGKRVHVGATGGLTTDIHVNPWIAAPLYSYVLASEGMKASGQWVAMRDLPGGPDWLAFFEHRCEKPCKKIADGNADFFDMLLRVFSGREVENHDEADVSVVLHPLPKLPILFRYWKADGDLPSDLSIFFDETATHNLPIESVYILTAGMVLMFEKIAHAHSYELG